MEGQERRTGNDSQILHSQEREKEKEREKEREEEREKEKEREKEREEEREKEKEREKEREEEKAKEVLLSKISEEREEISESYTRPEILPTPLSGGSSLTSPVKVISGFFQKREDGGTGETDGKRLLNSSLTGFRLSFRSSKEKKERKQEKEKEKERKQEEEKAKEVLLSEISEETEEISESYTRPEILPTPLSVNLTMLHNEAPPPSETLVYPAAEPCSPSLLAPDILERSFFIRMKSTLTKRGVHIKSSGFKVGDTSSPQDSRTDCNCDKGQTVTVIKDRL
ncbi:hypothetical protein NHX12_019701 [Muraenolepis orangiensis]|uniref:Uncharacterized protein n=1 Tax=Muraenolepis orangiensis TaxID=630683 RepID=A0A9Q0IU59_9TELE|nr:hypothetical protein NHX12_019701 [Muraenolepis orangiensis]